MSLTGLSLLSPMHCNYYLVLSRARAKLPKNIISFYLDSLGLILDPTLRRYHKQSLNVHLIHIHHYKWPCSECQSAPVNYCYKVTISVHCSEPASRLCDKRSLNKMYTKPSPCFHNLQANLKKTRFLFPFSLLLRRRRGGQIVRAPSSRVNIRLSIVYKWVAKINFWWQPTWDVNKMQRIKMNKTR